MIVRCDRKGGKERREELARHGLRRKLVVMRESKGMYGIGDSDKV